MEFINTGLDERILKSLDVEHPSEELVKAMNKQGLVQKEVTVQGKNGTFTRKQWVKASEVKDSSVSQSTMTQEEFNKKYPNGGMQDPVECLKHNGSDATWHGEKLQNPSVMKRAKEEYAQFKKDKAALEAGKSESSKTSVKKDSKSNKPSLSDIQGYGYDPATATGDPTYLQIGNKGYFKIGNNKWQYSPSQGSALGGTYTDAQISDMVSKTSDEVKVMPSAKKNSKSTQSDTSSQKSKDLSKMSESELKDRMKQVTTRMSELFKEINNNSKAQGQLNSTATQAQKKEYDELVEENGNLMAELGKRKPAQQSTGGQKLSPADAKKKTQEVTKGVLDKKSFMEKAKAQGITWKENDHEGINWMRCCMAMNKHFENGGTFDNSVNNSSTTGSSVNTSYTPFPTQTPQSIKDLYGKSKPKSPRLNATHIFETSKKSLADSGKLSPSSLTILKKAHFQVASDNAYQTMLDKYKTGFERDAITGYIGFYIKNDGFGTSSKVDQILDKLSKKYNMSSTEVYDKSDKLYEEFISTFDKYQVAIADNEFPEIKYELVSKVNRKYMNSK